MEISNRTKGKTEETNGESGRGVETVRVGEVGEYREVDEEQAGVEESHSDAGEDPVDLGLGGPGVCDSIQGSVRHFSIRERESRRREGGEEKDEQIQHPKGVRNPPAIAVYSLASGP